MNETERNQEVKRQNKEAEGTITGNRRKTRELVGRIK